MANKIKIADRADGGESLTRARAEKIAAIEGLQISPRVRQLLGESAHMSPDERRAFIASALVETTR